MKSRVFNAIIITMKRLYFKRYNSFRKENSESDLFWHSLSPEERVAVVDSLIVDMLKLKGKGDEGSPRLRRVCKVVKQK